MNVELTLDQRALVRRAIENRRFNLEEEAVQVASNGSIEIAGRPIDSITTRLFLLGTHPSAGRRRDDLRPGMRIFPVGEHLIAYRIEREDVLIQRVVRGMRDLETLFRG